MLNCALGTGIAVLVILLAACVYSIPGDLPVKGLKLPADAKLTARPVVRKYDPKPDRISIAGTWSMDFNSGCGWNDLVQQVEGQIGPLGYVELTCTDSQDNSFGNEFKSYYSADGLIEIFVSNNSESELGQISRDEYHDYSDYYIGVTELREPRERFTAVLETGKYYCDKKDFHWRLRNQE